MNRRLWCLGWIVLCIGPLGCALPQGRPGTLYQVSTLQALMDGAYEGVVPCGALRRHGDLGIGTFDGLDGEMVVLDGRVYQVRADGKVLAVPDDWKTPFATVALFRPDRQVALSGVPDMAALAQQLDRHLSTRNIFHIARVDGRFAYVKARSVPGQTPPYRPLVEVTRTQSVFEFHEIEGTLIALRCPEYAKGINMGGWHMHFLSRDLRQGGHVLEVQLREATAGIAHLHRFEMVLPEHGRFVEADLTRITAEEIHQVEQ